MMTIFWKKTEKTVPDNDLSLGAIYSKDKKSVAFSIWSPTATDIRVLLFEKGSDTVEKASFPLDYDRQTGVWSVEVYEASSASPSASIDGCACNRVSSRAYVLSSSNSLSVCHFEVPYSLDGSFYEYEIVQAGGKAKRCLDPYALSMAAFKNDGSSGRAAIVDLNGERAKPVPVASDKTARAGGDVALHCDKIARAGGDIGLHCGKTARAGGDVETGIFHRNDAIIYEVSVRDFTIDADTKATGGTYLAFIEKLPYIASLGVTHIQLMPVLNFYNNDETEQEIEKGIKTQNCNYNWGYDPHNYFTPEGWYSSAPEDPYSRIRELRALVDAIHSYGLRVILDVVYNHMAKTDFLDDIVKDYYFRLNEDSSFKSGSGCGNDIASEHIMARYLIVDSIVHWIKNYDVDGFRFDLMGLIDSETMVSAYKRASAIKPDTLFIGEGWKMYTGETGTVGLDQNYMTKTDDIAVFNDEYRDILKAGGMNEAGRGFLTNQAVDIEQLFKNLVGQPQKNYTVDSPSDNVQYIDCHDGFTLHDCIANNAKLDLRTQKGRNELFARLKLANAMLLTSQGIAFLHAGQECGRSKTALSLDEMAVAGSEYASSLPESLGRFVRNSYKSSDDVNKFSWNLSKQEEELFEYVKGLIALRKSNIIFRLRSLEEINYQTQLIKQSQFIKQSPLIKQKQLNKGNQPVLREGLVLTYALREDLCGQNCGCYFLVFNGTKECAKVRLSADYNGIRYKPAKNPSAIQVFVDGKKASKEGRTLEQSDVLLEADGTFKVKALSTVVMYLPA